MVEHITCTKYYTPSWIKPMISNSASAANPEIRASRSSSRRRQAPVDMRNRTEPVARGGRLAEGRQTHHSASSTCWLHVLLLFIFTSIPISLLIEFFFTYLDFIKTTFCNSRLVVIVKSRKILFIISKI